jgi:hypothetical protein
LYRVINCLDFYTDLEEIAGPIVPGTYEKTLSPAGFFLSLTLTHLPTKTVRLPIKKYKDHTPRNANKMK